MRKHKRGTQDIKGDLIMTIRAAETAQLPVSKKNIGDVMKKYVKDFREVSKKQHHYEERHVGGNGYVNSYYDKDNKPLFTLQYQKGDPSNYVYKMTNEHGEKITFVDLDADGNMDSVAVSYPDGRYFISRDLNDDGKYNKNDILDIKM